MRQEGWIPAVVYGPGEDPLSVAVERKALDTALHTAGGRNHVYSIQVDEKTQRDVLIKDYQLDPVRDELIHVDFLFVTDKYAVTVKVPIHTAGEPIGVKEEGGMLVPLLRELPVRCLPQDIPEEILVDVSGPAVE